MYTLRSFFISVKLLLLNFINVIYTSDYFQWLNIILNLITYNCENYSIIFDFKEKNLRLRIRIMKKKFSIMITIMI